MLVVPLAGTWIETLTEAGVDERIIVVPLAGTWIETPVALSVLPVSGVVPLAGTWIETPNCTEYSLTLSSFPLRERGLKHERKRKAALIYGRSPCGNVD